MSKVKKNLSLEKGIANKGLARAKELGYNFSSYITYLINQDCIGKTIVLKESEEIVVEKNEPDIGLSEDVLSSADDILNM